MEDLNRICAAMMLFSALWTVPIYGQSRPFDLKGDVLGESIAQFKARNSQASCSRFSDVEVECKDPSASFAEHMPYIWLEKPGYCFGCGLAADFFHGKLPSIAYTVSGRWW